MSHFKVGVAKRDITPSWDLIKAGSIYLSGLAIRESEETGVAKGVRDPIWARVLAIRDCEGTCVVLVSLDVLALDPEDTQEIKARVEKVTSPRQHIAINVTHTHSGPVTIAVPTWNDGFDQPNLQYMTFLKDQVVSAIQDAVDHMQDATLSFARGQVALGVNRHPGLMAYDKTLDVIQARNTDNQVMAIAFFHGCHPVILEDSLISSDFPGVARLRIEQRHPGAMAIYFQGYAGTIDPAKHDLEWAGSTLSNAVNQLLDGPMYPLKGTIQAQTLELELPFQCLDTDMLNLAAAQQISDIYYISSVNLKRWADYMISLGDSAPDTLPTQLQAIRLGTHPQDWWLVACSHEVVAEFAVPVREIWNYPRLTLMGYTNWQKSYLPDYQVLSNPYCAYNGAYGAYNKVFPFCDNYEGGISFTWYGHRAPIKRLLVDHLLMNSHVELLEKMGGVRPHFGFKGVIYAVSRGGELYWYKDLARNGTPCWVENFGMQIGEGWTVFARVFSGGDGIIYSVDQDGFLYWHQDQAQNGTYGWAHDHGMQIGNGWGHFSFVFYGGDGIIYAVDQDDGTLYWYQDLARDGSPLWKYEYGKKIGDGWGHFKFVFYGGDGIIYAVDQDGSLYWYQDLARDGSPLWKYEYGKKIGDGWDHFKFVFYGGDGIIYAVDNKDGSLYWYQDLARDGSRLWKYEHGKKIGDGWGNFIFVFSDQRCGP